MVNSFRAGTSGVARRIAPVVAPLTVVLALCCNKSAHADELEPIEQVKQVDLSHSSGGWGHFFDVTNPFAAVEYAYDSNILRLDDRTPAIGSRWDQYGVVDVGFASNLKEGQQQFIVNGIFSPHSYHQHPELNYQGGAFASVWHWADSPALTGTLGYRFKRSLRDFANQLSPSRVKDIRNDNRFLGSADWNFKDHWVWNVNAEYADINFDATPSLDLHKATAGTALTYVSNAGNELGLDFVDYRGTYVNSSGISYNEYDVGPTLTWKYTVRTELTAKVAYSSRKYSGTGGPFRGERPSYSGPTANFNLTIADAGRGAFTATAYQEVSNLTDEVPDYAIIDGVSLRPSWTLSNNMNIELRATYEHRDFKDITGGIARQDDVGSFTALFAWPIGRHWKISASTTTEKRSSTRYLQGYEYLLQQVQVTGIL